VDSKARAGIKGLPGAYCHLTIVAKDAEGLRNLYRLHDASFRDGFYFKPRIDLALLEQHSRGLVVTTGCAGSIASTLLRLGLVDRAVEHVETLKDICDDVYVEMMQHGTALDRQLIPLQWDLMNRTNLLPVATNDSHFLYPGDQKAHDSLLCLQTNAKLSDDNRFRFSGSGYWLKSREEMEETKLPELALDTTLRIAEEIGSYASVFEPKLRMPLAHPDEADLGWCVFEGMAERLGVETYRLRLNHPEYTDRLDYELRVINGRDFGDYFTIWADVVSEARLRGIERGTRPRLQIAGE